MGGGKSEDLSYIEPEALETVFGKRSVRYSDLQSDVKAVLDSASAWEKWGEDTAIMVSSVVFVLPLGLWLMGSANVVTFAIGALMLGYLHGMAIVKVAHSFRFILSSQLWLVTELIGAFPVEVAVDGHVKVHHPHTNILGLGDSSTWRAPALGRTAYLFVAPLLLPLITPLLGVAELLQIARPKRIIQFVLTAASGFLIQYMLYRHVSGLPPLSALMWTAGTRALFMPCYIHVNIFQHIGLSMYAPENRPDRISQMSYGVLNIARHPILDMNFGHSIINCHVEHHLFPRLPDRLCLKIKPTVFKFCQDNGLPYFEKTYANRLQVFFNKYEELMVNAPPVTKFVSVQ